MFGNDDMLHRRLLAAVLGTVCGSSLASAQEQYTYENLGSPTGADSVVGVRMNNLGQVAGWSQYFGQGEPSLKGWVWTPGSGFEVLPPPSGFFEGRSRAIDINDHGVVAGDGGFDIGLAWRYENGAYEVTGSVNGMPIAYLGGMNNAGDLAGTAKDARIVTPDYAFVDFNGGSLMSITPNGGRAVDINNAGQVCGYSGGFAAFRWDIANGPQPLGNLGLAYAFPARMNDSGQIVGVASSASGNTDRAWIYTDGLGMLAIPGVSANASRAISINNDGHVVGMSSRSGPDLCWLWTGGAGAVAITTLFDPVGENVNLIEVRDVNDRGQILVQVFDNNVAEFRMAILTPPETCYPDCTGEGALDVFDFLCFQDAFTLGDPYADCDGNTTLDVFDFLCFQDAFVAGCK